MFPAIMRLRSVFIIAVVAAILPALSDGLKCYMCDSRMNPACGKSFQKNAVPLLDMKETGDNASCYLWEGRRALSNLGGVIEDYGYIRGGMLTKNLKTIMGGDELLGLDVRACNSDFCNSYSNSNSIVALSLCVMLCLSLLLVKLG